jgi:hypothetical protein
MTASMGLPDLSIITVDEAIFFIRQIARASGLPVPVDGGIMPAKSGRRPAICGFDWHLL